MPTGTPFDLQFEILPLGVAGDAFEGKVERIFIDGGEFADAHTHNENLSARMFLCLGGDAFENRRGNSDFVHSRSLTNTGQLIAREHIDNAGSTERRTHHDHARMVGRDVADDRSVFAERMALQGLQRVLSGGGRDDGY